MGDEPNPAKKEDRDALPPARLNNAREALDWEKNERESSSTLPL